MKTIASDAVKSVYFKIDPFKRVNTFEVRNIQNIQKLAFRT